MRRTLAVLLLVPGVAAADDDPGERIPTTVHARLDGTTATFSLRYVVEATGPNLDRELAELPLPHRGIVTGATAAVEGGLHRLALDPAEHAAATFNELATLAVAPRRMWAVHIAASRADAVTVEAAAPHDARVAIELEATAPTCFYKDLRFVAVPKAWARVLDRGLEQPHREDLDAVCDPELVTDHVWIGFASREVAAQPFGDRRIGAAAGRLDLPSDHLAHVELDLAQRISQVPPDLATVFVVDGSRSLTAQQAESQQAIIASYLRLAPRSRVQIVEFDRKAHALLPSWMPASQAMTRIARELGALPGNNGSNLEVGLAEAGTWLSRIDGTRRVVLFTDELVPSRLGALDPAGLRKTLPEGTLVHVVALDAGALARDDDELFAPLAKATEGIALRGGADDNGRTDALELVRPIAFEQVMVNAPGWLEFQGPGTACQFDGTAVFAEGASCEWWVHGTANAGPIRIDGLVWNHHVVRVLQPDRSATRTLARTLSVGGIELDDQVRTEIDRAAFAINTVWSMIGTWGGIGGYADLPDLGFGMIGSGCGCGTGGSSDSIGVGHIGTIAAKLDLKAQLEHAIAPCRPGTARIEIALELTLNEIVDVSVTAPDGGTRLHDCVVEAVWETSVAIGNAPKHSSTHVVIGG